MHLVFRILLVLPCWLAVATNAAALIGAETKDQRILQQQVDGTLLVAISTTRLDQFLVLVAFTDEETVLADVSNALTVFGPLDDALQTSTFSRLTILGYRKLHLPNFVQTHIVESSVSSVMLGSTITTKSGEVFAVTSNEGTVTLSNSLGSSTVTTPDTQADNGILHVIDTPLLPRWFGLTVADVASEAGSLFADLLASTSLDAELRNKDSEFTVLVPTNAAIEALPNGIWDRVQASPSYAEELVHAHAIRNIYTVNDLRGVSQLLTGQQAPFFTWNMEPTGTDSVNVNGNLLVDVEQLGYNGLVHNMDGVFLPGNGPPTMMPSAMPSEAPSKNPTDTPTVNPTYAPTVNPTEISSTHSVSVFFAAMIGTAAIIAIFPP